MATASASSGFWAAHFEIECPLKGSQDCTDRLGFLDGTRRMADCLFVFSRSQISPSIVEEMSNVGMLGV